MAVFAGRTPHLDEDAYFRNLCEDYAKARDAWWADGAEESK